MRSQLSTTDVRPRRLVASVALGTALALACAASGTEDASAQSVRVTPDAGRATVVDLPVRYDAGRFFLAPVTADGDTLSLYTDTGGGSNMIYRGAVERLGLETLRVEVGGDSVDLTALPTWKPGAAVPPPVRLPPAGSWLLVRGAPSWAEGDGFLGRTWFAGRVWLFDYPDGSLGRVLAWDPGPYADEHRVRLGFQVDSTGRRTTHFPRVRIAVDGDSLDMLFDTGATVSLDSSARERIGDGRPADRGTSFVVDSVYEAWRREHPDWRVVEGADRRNGAPMIEVPEVSVGGHAVGPVWFTVRPDENFHDRMSQWMDRRVDGALGGSALRDLRVLVDYPAATAVFLRPEAPREP